MGLIVLVIILLVASCAVLFGGTKGAQLGDSFGIKGKGDAACTGLPCYRDIIIFCSISRIEIDFPHLTNQRLRKLSVLLHEGP